MIVITGAAGFIGSCLLTKLNQENFKDIVLVDDFSNNEKSNNYANKKFTLKVERNDFFSWIHENENSIQFIFHLGARTNTAEFDQNLLDELNLNYSKKVWKLCVKYGLPLIYASSAATYGLGECGYDEDNSKINQLKPLNAYAKSKSEFDKWALNQSNAPYYWSGIKFFNVYGPNEYHKKRMASVVLHAYNQIMQTDKMKLFKSYNSKYKDGEQLRDFIYVKDVIDVLFYLMNHRKDSGIYNLGTANANTFSFLTDSVFNAINKTSKIEFIDMPEDIRSSYQYYTQANIKKLRKIGYKKQFFSLENGIKDYVFHYLKNHTYF